MKTILITGGGGNIGRELAMALAAKGHNVRTFGRTKASMEGLESFGIKTIQGDITDPVCVKTAAADADLVIHLAAMLPPMTESREEAAYAVNVLGTKNLVDAVMANGNKARVIFLSSVATYGDTTASEPFVTAQTRQAPNSVYSKTKFEAERCILNSGISYTILRVSAVFVAALLDPPLWPCMPDQRVEFVFRDDVVTAIMASVENEAAANRILIVSGGKSWQMKGSEFVEQYMKILDVPIEEAEYPEAPVYSDWYDTEESQRLLKYQNTSFSQYLLLLQSAVDEALA